MKCLTHAAATILSDPKLRKIYYERVMEQRAADSSSPAGRGIKGEGVSAAVSPHPNPLPEGEGDGDIEERMKRFWQRLGYTPGQPSTNLSLSDMEPAEAWMAEHPEEITSETAPTVGALKHLARTEHARLKAARERLREVGIR